MPLAIHTDCFSNRIARAGRHVERGEWASGHAILSGLRKCGARRGCADSESCARAAEAMLGDLQGLLRDSAREPHS